MRKIGILGLSNKSELMLKLIKKVKTFEITGIYDVNTALSLKIAENSKVPFNPNPFGLIIESDLVIISKTDSNSFNFIVESILNSRHVVIENPVNLSLNEIDELNKLATEAAVSVVPFLPFRFSNCLINTKSYIFNPGYLNISFNSTPEYKTTAADTLGNLLNIIDICVNLVKANIKKVQANAVRIVGKIPQLINANLEFDNGCSAFISLDFISNRDELLISVYQPKQIVNIDLKKNFSIIKTFNKDNILEFDITKPVVSKDENPYEEIINYLITFETFQTPVSIMESFRSSLSIFKKVEDKITHYLQ